MNGGSMKHLLLAVVLVATSPLLTPVAKADMPLANYELLIPSRNDFHTWVWRFNPCDGACVHVNAVPRPVAKAFPYRGDAQLANGRYTLTVDVPDGLRCDNIYYGPTIPTHDVYSWDAQTLAGSLDSSYDAGCDGAPGGTFTYPFTLSRT
jgi:hypothetical protein